MLLSAISMTGQYRFAPLLGAVLLLAQQTPRTAAGAGEWEPFEDMTVDYTIIVTGSELLTGIYADGHTHFLTRTLRPLGLHCVGSMSVDDQAADIKQALDFARKRSQMVIVTGGLGPTDSDITREVLSEYTGIPLSENSEVVGEMERRFRTPRDQLRSNLRRQARVPTQGTFLKNASGTAVGLVFEHKECVIVALPGPPRELQPMVIDQLLPYLTRRFGTRLVGCSLTVRFVGLGQSQIDQTMKDQIPLPSDVMQSSQFEAGRVDFTFALAQDRPQDRARLDQLKQELHKYLGDNIYADDAATTLEDHVAGLLLAAGQTVALAEVGSGGSLADGIGHTELAKRVLAGGFVAPTEDHLRRMLEVPDDRWSAASSPQKSGLLADAVARHARSEWVVVVGEPTADPQGNGQLVNVVVRRPHGEFVVRTARWPGNGAAAQSRLATELFDLVRRELR